jgi:predicted MPP superfamily phosphohydrolase
MGGVSPQAAGAGTLPPVFISILLMLIAIGVWWRVRLADGLKEFKSGRWWGYLATAFLVFVIFCPIVSAELGRVFYFPVAAAGFLWQLLVVPVVLLVIGLVELLLWWRSRRRVVVPVDTDRRKLMTAMFGLAPPLATLGLTGIAQTQLGKFRVRELAVDLADWPAALNGFTIAFVADVHNGPFTTPKMLEDLVERTNTINRGAPADLVLFGGDLINTSLRDLPEAMEMIKALRGRLGTLAILGNHDVMDNGYTFISTMDKSGIPLLRDQVATVHDRALGGRFQVLGVDWQAGDPAINRSVQNSAAQRDVNLFPICLAHHPHAWDEAVRQGLPLVLSGHTHGGQIMLNDRIGAGPLRFRYWNGVHQRSGSQLIITNGVGSWFPLRVNAPAEILKLTLNRAASVAQAPIPPQSEASRARPAMG